jgi:hypothetical protein
MYGRRKRSTESDAVVSRSSAPYVDCWKQARIWATGKGQTNTFYVSHPSPREDYTLGEVALRSLDIAPERTWALP